MDIFDEIIQCLQSEKDQYGNVFVSSDHLKEFFANVSTSSRPEHSRKPLQQQDTQGLRSSLPPSGEIRSTHAVPHPEQHSAPLNAQFNSQRRVMEQPHAPVTEAETPAESPQRKDLPPSPEAIAAMDWNQLRIATSRCRGCRLCETRTNVVFADGNEHAELMFIGEGPGADEDAQGVPFVGKAGQLLSKMIAAMQFKREEVYIANIVKCRPPGNRNPTDDEMASCLPYLLRQIELVRPKVIVLLGSVALKGLLNRSGIMRMRGHWLDYRGIMVMPTFHPAYLLRYEAGKKDAWSDLQQVMKVFGKVYKKAR